MRPAMYLRDSECALSTVFLSSSESQDGSYAMLRLPFTVFNSFAVINALWRGDLVQRRNDDNNVVCKSRTLELVAL